MLDLYLSVGRYIPNLPHEEIRHRVSTYHLLTHTSGLGNIYSEQSTCLYFESIQELCEKFTDRPLDLPPGTDYQYSGSGFILLGLLIEKISGMTYYEYIQKNILDVAGKTNTLPIDRFDIVPLKASGYTCYWRDSEIYLRNDSYLSKASPRWVLLCNGCGLIQFLSGLQKNTLLQESTKKLMFTPQVKGYNTHLGMGIDIDKRRAEVILGHSGGWYGIHGELMHFPESNFTAIVLSNKDDDGTFGASKLITELKLIIGGKMEKSPISEVA